MEERVYVEAIEGPATQFAPDVHAYQMPRPSAPIFAVDDGGLYDDIDYGRALSPPLHPADAEWAITLLLSKK